MALQRVLEDDEGRTYVEAVTDPETGKPVVSREAMALRDATIEKLAMLDGVPAALDQIVWAFGTDAVAEVTGRSKRPVRVEDAGGQRMKIEKRSASASAAETRAFMEGAKQILVFSEAGGTGRSYHAALTARNQARRIHYLLEAGWKADSAVQGLGRSHRAAQASAPMFRVMSTDVAGEKRFVSTIARRLDTLGALTKGQRQTGSQGLFRAEDSLESPIAYAALRQFYRRIIAAEAESVVLENFESLTGLKLTSEDGVILEDLPPMPRWLNRILALEVDTQNAIFAEFAEIVTARTEIAREMGTLDLGVETIRAHRLIETGREPIAVDERAGAVTELVEMERTDVRVVLSAAEAFVEHEAAIDLRLHRETGEPVFVHRTSSEYSDEGEIIRRVKLYGPGATRIAYTTAFEAEPWDEIAEAAFRGVWDDVAGRTPREVVSRFHVVTGLLLPIWKHLPDAEQRIWRVMTGAGATVLGRVIGEADAGRLRAALCPSEVIDPATLLAALTQEARRIDLSSGAALAVRRIGAGKRIEIEAAPVELLPMLKAAGCFTEIIQWRTRVFLPFNPEAAVESLPHLARLLEILPIAGMEAKVAA